MFTSGLILGMAVGALVAIIFMMVIMAQVVKQNGQQKDDVKTTNAAAREYWNFMAEETNSQTFALKQISTSLRELAKIPPTVGGANRGRSGRVPRHEQPGNKGRHRSRSRKILALRVGHGQHY